MSNLTVRFRAALWWLLPLAALPPLIGWETDWGSALDTRPEPAAAIAPKPVVASLLPEYAIAGGVAARTETVERTLFNPTRRPAPVAAQDGAAARLQRGQFALTGTMLVDGKSTAFLREVAGNKSRRVQAGETINGLLVAEVKPDRVKFTMGDESEELVLKVATNPRPTAPPARRRAGGAAARRCRPAARPPAAQPGGRRRARDAAAQTLAERRRAARARRRLPAGRRPRRPMPRRRPRRPQSPPPAAPPRRRRTGAPTQVAGRLPELPAAAA